MNKHIFKDAVVNHVMWKWLEFYDYVLLNTSNGLVLSYTLIETVPVEVTEREVVEKFMGYIEEKIETSEESPDFVFFMECDRSVLENHLGNI